MNLSLNSVTDWFCDGCPSHSFRCALYLFRILLYVSGFPKASFICLVGFPIIFLIRFSTMRVRVTAASSVLQHSSSLSASCHTSSCRLGSRCRSFLRVRIMNSLNTTNDGVVFVRRAGMRMFCLVSSFSSALSLVSGIWNTVVEIVGNSSPRVC